MKKITKKRGASLVEYALLTALISLVCISALQSVGRKIRCRGLQISQALANPGIANLYFAACNPSNNSEGGF